MRRGYRALSGILAFIMTITVLPTYNLVNGFVAEAKDSAVAIGSGQIAGTAVENTQTLLDNGDGTFTLSIDISANNYNHDNNIKKTEAKTGYFTAPVTGSYLVELWGGDGAAGEDKFSPGGNGGNSGHVYGIVNLKEGQTIFYTIGGNGSQVSRRDEVEGANQGTSHGNIGSTKVGGGGGYSAVYLFDKNEFENKGYIDSEGNLLKEDVTEQDRLSKYIMIAAGGGGGGAGQQVTIIPSAIGRPSGGNGGNIDSDYTPIEYDGGYVFPGEDGKSSTRDTRYIGHGGNTEPGSASDTWIGWIDGDQPNDWTGAVNSKLPGGAGGNGDMRGGGGGAGYAGGSGGVMAGLLMAWDIGGGGGGSSYVRGDCYFTYDSLNADVKRQLVDENTSKTGGSIHYARLDNEKTGEFYSPYYLSNMEFNVDKISEYFDVEDVTASITRPDKAAYDTQYGEVTCVGTLNGDKSYTVNLTGNFIDADREREADVLTIKYVLKPREGFIGGNKVNLFATGNEAKIEYSGGLFNNPVGDRRNGDDILLKEKCSYVNVPLDVNLLTHDQKHVAEGTEEHCTDSTCSNRDGEHPAHKVTISDLYENEDFLSSLSEEWMGHFITGASDCVVKKNGTTIAGTDTIENTARYEVSRHVTLLHSTPAEVGEPVNSDIKTIATVTVLKAGDGKINGNKVNYKKTLSYDANDADDYQDDTYELNLKANIETPEYVSEVIEFKGVKFAAATLSLSESGETFNVPITGWYLLEATGATGGNGYDKTGKGAMGGYVYGAIHLNEGDTITYYVGMGGLDGTRTAKPGKGGNPGYIKKGSTYLLVAAGGGGGGSNASYPGQTPLDDSTVLGSVPNGYVGPNGSNKIVENTRTNYINTEELKFDNSTNFLADSTLLDAAKEKKDTYGDKIGVTYPGQILITGLEADKSSGGFSKEDIEDTLKYYQYNATVSQYFDVTAVKVNGTTYTASEYAANGISVVPDGETTKITVNYDASDSIVIDNPSSGDPKKRIDVGKASIDISFIVSPKEEFLGGNDVPVLEEGTTITVTQCKDDWTPWETNYSLDGEVLKNDDDEANDKTMEVDQLDVTDYANVRIPFSVLGLTTNNYVYQDGDEPIPLKDLFDLESDAAKKLPPAKSSTDWRQDYVTITDPHVSIDPSGTDKPVDLESPASESYAPKVTTNYTFGYGIERTDAVKAVEGPVIKDDMISKTAIITVKEKRFAVIYQLSPNISDEEYDNPTDIVKNTELVTKFKVNDGYALKDAKVEIGGKELADSEYTLSETDKVITITVPEDEITADVTITINTKKENAKHTVFIYAQTNANNPDSGQIIKTMTGLEDGTEITLQEIAEKVGFTRTDANGTYIPNQDYTGYHYEWRTESLITDNIVIDGEDIFIYGQFILDSYGLVIHCYEDGTTNPVRADLQYTLDPSSDEKESGNKHYKLLFGSDYAIQVPEVDGYVALTNVVEGTVDADFVSETEANANGYKEVTVYYIPKTGNLTVYYQYADSGKKVAEPFIGEISSVNREYNVPIPSIDDYTPSITSFSGTATDDDIANGIVKTVYYMPNEVSVKFDFNAPSGVTATGDASKLDRQIAINNVYGSKVKIERNASDEIVSYETIYEGLQDARTAAGISGYDFLGWNTEADGSGMTILSDTEIDADKDGIPDVKDSTWDPSEPITLYAQWKKTEYNMLVNFVYGSDVNPYTGEKEGDFVGTTHLISTPTDENVMADLNDTYGFTVKIPDTAKGYKLDKVAGTTVSDAKTQTEMEAPYTILPDQDGVRITGTFTQDKHQVLFVYALKTIKYQLTVDYEYGPGVSDLDMDADALQKPGPVTINYYYNQPYNFSVLADDTDYTAVIGANIERAKAQAIVDTTKYILSPETLSGKMPAENMTTVVYINKKDSNLYAIMISPVYDDGDYDIDHSGDTLTFTITKVTSSGDVDVTMVDKNNNPVTGITGDTPLTVFVDGSDAEKFKIKTKPALVIDSSKDPYDVADYDIKAGSAANATGNIILSPTVKFEEPIVKASVDHLIVGDYANLSKKILVDVTITLPDEAPDNIKGAAYSLNGNMNKIQWNNKSATISIPMSNNEGYVIEGLPKNTSIQVGEIAASEKGYTRTALNGSENVKKPEGSKLTEDGNVVIKDTLTTTVLTGVRSYTKGYLYLFYVAVVLGIFCLAFTRINYTRCRVRKGGGKRA